MTIGCVYIITNTINGSAYIGKSVKGLGHRMAQHMAAARRGEDWAFYRAVRKYGEAAFEISELFSSDVDEELLAAEIKLIAQYRENGTCLYNSTLGGQGAAGRVASDATRARISAKAKGRRLSPEHKAKIAANSTKGARQSAEFRSNLSQRKKEYWEARRAQGLGGHSHVLTEEGRRILSENAKARWAERRKTGCKAIGK